jgi:NADH-quinone oxidoreductase subunit C
MRAREATEHFKIHYAEIIAKEIEFLGEITLEVRPHQIKQILSFFKQEGGFEVLMDLTAVDYVYPEKKTKVVYWLHHPSNFERIRIVTVLNRDEPITSVSDLWAGADWYERELYDLFGVKIEGHPDLKRILMPDDWVGHPLRRDYALTEEPVQFKHGVKPKVPSEILSYGNNKNARP